MTRWPSLESALSWSHRALRCGSATTGPHSTVLLSLIPRFAREHHTRGLAAHDHLGLDGLDMATAGVGEELVGGAEQGELLEVLDGGEDQLELPRAVGLQGRAGR